MWPGWDGPKPVHVDLNEGLTRSLRCKPHRHSAAETVVSTRTPTDRTPGRPSTVGSRKSGYDEMEPCKGSSAMRARHTAVMGTRRTRRCSRRRPRSCFLGVRCRSARPLLPSLGVRTLSACVVSQQGAIVWSGHLHRRSKQPTRRSSPTETWMRLVSSSHWTMSSTSPTRT
jgi:hypothetical protein